MTELSTNGDRTGPAAIVDLEVDSTLLERGVITPRRALFFALSGLTLPMVLSGQGATMAFSSGWSSWLAMIVGSLIVGALATIVARFSRRHLATGSLMSYVNIEAGERLGAFVGVALFFGYASCLAGFMAMALVFLLSFLHSLGIEITNNLEHVGIAAILLGICVWLARRGVSLSVNAAVILGWIGMPFVLVSLIAAVAYNGVSLAPQLDLHDFSLSSFAPGVVLAFGIYAGFEGVTSLAMETDNPRRTIPPVLTMVVIVGALVALAGIFLTMPLMMANQGALNEGSSPLSLLAEAGHMSALGSIADALIFLTIVGSMLAFINAAGRIAGTAAQDGLLPKTLAYIDPQRHTPARATIFISLLALLGLAANILLGRQPIYTTFVSALSMTSYAWMIAYVVVAVVGTVDAVRSRNLAFGLVSMFGLFGTGFIVLYSITQKDGSTSVLIWVVLGTVTFLWVAAMVTRRLRVRASIEEVL